MNRVCRMSTLLVVRMRDMFTYHFIRKVEMGKSRWTGPGVFKTRFVEIDALGAAIFAEVVFLTGDACTKGNTVLVLLLTGPRLGSY